MKIKAAAVRYPGREFKEELVYAELKYCCHHGGKVSPQGPRGIGQIRLLEKLAVYLQSD